MKKKETIIDSEELEKKLDELFEFVSVKFQDLRQMKYANIDVQKHYITLIRPLSAFEAMYRNYKEIISHKGASQCKCCLEWRNEDEMDKSELGLADGICKQCMSNGYRREMKTE